MGGAGVSAAGGLRRRACRRRAHRDVPSSRTGLLRGLPGRRPGAVFHPGASVGRQRGRDGRPLPFRPPALRYRPLPAHRGHALRRLARARRARRERRRRERRALRRVGAQRGECDGGRRVQRLGYAPPSHAAAQRRRVGTLHARPRRRHGLQVQRPLPLRRLPAAQGRSLRLLLRDAAEIGVGGLGPLQIPVGRCRVDGAARQNRAAQIADGGLRSPPGMLDARPQGQTLTYRELAGQAGGIRAGRWATRTSSCCP